MSDTSIVLERDGDEARWLDIEADDDGNVVIWEQAESADGIGLQRISIPAQKAGDVARFILAVLQGAAR